MKLTSTVCITDNVTVYAKWNYIGSGTAPEDQTKPISAIDYFDDSQFEVFNSSETKINCRYAGGSGSFLYSTGSVAQSAYTMSNWTKVYTHKNNPDGETYYKVDMLPGRTTTDKNDIIRNNNTPIWQKAGEKFDYWYVCQSL